MQSASLRGCTPQASTKSVLSITVATAMPCIGATPGAAVRPDRALVAADCGVAERLCRSRPSSVRRCTSRIACRVTSSSVNVDCIRESASVHPCRLYATDSTQAAPLLKLSARHVSLWPCAVHATAAAAWSLSPSVALAARTLAQMGFAIAAAKLWAVRRHCCKLLMFLVKGMALRGLRAMLLCAMPVQVCMHAKVAVRTPAARTHG